MDCYKIVLRLAAPSLTPWQADTIFGHLCWALAHTEGDDFLDNFLGLYGLGEPPLVVSNGFPGELLPRPLLAAPPAARAAGPAAYRAGQALRAAAWLTPEEFERARGGEAFLPEPRQPFATRVSLHNRLSRLTGTTGATGSLYQLVETTLAPEFAGTVNIYALVDPGFVACLRRCLAYLEATGYGKRKSAGFGALAAVELQPWAGFPPLPGANGFVALSHFVPAAGDPARGAWRTLVKRGRLGEEFAALANPFKRPLLMLQAGACFYDAPVRPFYGRLVSGVHPGLPQVVQYGLTLAAEARLPEPAGEEPGRG
ncbi:MAG: hypothetical protein M1401_09960 [Chloroflexi bacterium]|nr:hypothetical protein [Chloroflexota bacterium]